MQTNFNDIWYEIHKMTKQEPDYSECLGSYSEDETDAMFQNAIDLSNELDCSICILEVISDNNGLKYNCVWDNLN